MSLDELKPSRLITAEEILITANQGKFRTSTTAGGDLQPLEDGRGIFCLKGRLENAPVPYETKTPILLDKNHPLSNLIILDIHTRLKHIGLTLLAPGFFLGGVKTRWGGTLYHTPITFEQELLEG